MPGVKKGMQDFAGKARRVASKTGPVVTNRKRAIAIGLAEQRKAGMAPLAPNIPKLLHPGDDIELAKMHTSKHR